LQDPSVDGLKTGHVEEAGFHLIATAERENRRYIAVIMGAEKTETRDKEAMQLLDFGFNDFITVRLFNKDDILTHLPVKDGVKGEVGLRPTEDGIIKIPSSFREFISYEIESPTQKEAPIELNQKLGQVKISYRKEILKMIPLLANEDIQQANAKTPEIEPVTSFVVGQKYMLFVIFILICVLVIEYLYIRWLRRQLKETNTEETELVKKRLDKILKSNRDG
jgi:D-alanyl-D-alanine carboxypeptidase (penicillin-binding protein 5/6)